MTTRNGQIKNFTSNFGPQHPAAHVWHEAADAESAPMPLDMYALLGPPARWRSRSASRAPG
ncbi:hypothetical protein TSUD_85530 [Trifolium subterraneum]|uniref:Uncharacterized protein n=1 Tax=Trifolium subterraneum TaxID=3900 RepID=A0A2Z6P4X3_TRISU|nr:hypothetical protein TSUD_85530 [Trifolium subterraneum]